MPDGTTDLFIENRTFDELVIGETASLSHTVTQRDIDLFATVTGDVNPAHVDPAYAVTDMFHHVIIQGMWGGGLISAVLGTKLPGPGTIYLGQDLRFVHPVCIGDTITATVTVREKQPGEGDVVLDCLCTNQMGKAVITGTAFIRAPRRRACQAGRVARGPGRTPRSHAGDDRPRGRRRRHPDGCGVSGRYDLHRLPRWTRRRPG